MTEQNDWCVYLIECNDNSYYCGVTNNLDKRFKAHEAGKGAKYTKGRGPLKLIAHTDHLSRSEAQQLEYKIKKMKKSDKPTAFSKGGLHRSL